MVGAVRDLRVESAARLRDVGHDLKHGMDAARIK